MPPDALGCVDVSLWANAITMVPPTIAALAALVAAARLREPLRRTEHRADQLFNGEFARGKVEGHAEADRQAGQFTQS